MCDYSMHSVKTRNAEQGDVLVTCGFAGTHTRGLQRVEDAGFTAYATCLKPGTEVVFLAPVRTKDIFTSVTLWLFGKRSRALAHRTAKFVQRDMDKPAVHHDAFEFPGGTLVYVTALKPGQKVRVLQVPAPSTGPFTIADVGAVRAQERMFGVPLREVEPRGA